MPLTHFRIHMAKKAAPRQVQAVLQTTTDLPKAEKRARAEWPSSAILNTNVVADVRRRAQPRSEFPTKSNPGQANAWPWPNRR